MCVWIYSNTLAVYICLMLSEIILYVRRDCIMSAHTQCIDLGGLGDGCSICAIPALIEMRLFSLDINFYWVNKLKFRA